MKLFGNKTKWIVFILLIILFSVLSYFFFYNYQYPGKKETMQLGGDTFEVTAKFFSTYSLFICTSAVVPITWPASPVKISLSSNNFLDGSGNKPSLTDTFSTLPTNIIAIFNLLIKQLQNTDSTNIFYFFNKMFPTTQTLLQNIINVITGSSPNSIYIWFGPPSSDSPGAALTPGGSMLGLATAPGKTVKSSPG
jgi:hypothetical protein